MVPTGKCTCGPLAATWCDTHLKSRLATALHCDIVLRGGELAKLVRHGLECDDRRLKGFLWSPKTHEGMLYPFFVAHCCGDYQAEWCTPCLFDLFWLRFGDQPALLDVDVRAAADRKPSIPPIWTCGLFLYENKSRDTGLRKALGKDRCSKMIKAAFTFADFDSRWNVHKLRAFASSKAVNMGFPWEPANTRGRWSEKSGTFRKNYYRRTLFLEESPENRTKSFEFVLRLKETIIS